ncbi:granulocyte-macrophage colony-stimulating factor receptor subunit alpha-like [Pteropus vampyrus]|uniref:Granulocyte-macrophage colony-stimulating factor receptor subunit alpha-like n=1 Tax=Pteropus vampyrus TaxID=132908 RepID=A0A6P3RIP1_PTEVA|nr:granulocyte-macrophage colony-stimulating factor receptor subunit alpha-like [Pteropus vampyrus]
MEKYNPPANITIRYNGSCHVIRWDNPETRFEMSSHMLCYELDIQRQVRTPALGEAAQAPVPTLGAMGSRVLTSENATPLPEAPPCHSVTLSLP